MTVSLMHQWHDTICGGVIGLPTDERRIHPRQLSELLVGIPLLFLDSYHSIRPSFEPVEPRWSPRPSNPPEFSGPAFEAAVQRPVVALLPGLTTRLTNEIRHNGTGGSGDQPPTIHTWLERSEQQKPEREYHTIRQRDGETNGELMKRFLRLADGIVNTKFTDVAQVANAARNMEILHERSSQNNKRNRDRDCIRLTARDINQRGYDQKGYNGRSYDMQGGNSQKRYPDYASFPPCDIYGKLHPGKTCHRVTGAYFTCGSTGHMARDCLKNGGNGGRGDENDNQPTTKGRVFSSTKDQAANSSDSVDHDVSIIYLVHLYLLPKSARAIYTCHGGSVWMHPRYFVPFSPGNEREAGI
ncbi:zinc finger, CCHC-type, retrotransposon gag domain protein [Tanacetum coccineum]